MRGIKPLPEGVRNSVRSGVILYDLTKVVEELVFNSLDAGATKVSVAVGVVTCFVKVADNGSGIDRDGLMLLGERYATSKHDHLADLGTSLGSFGFHGEALCSISDVSVLEVISKSHGMPHGYRKVMKNCKCLYLGISDDRHDVGTTVIVRDLFYNQPVRRKHVLSSPKKVLHLAKKCVLRIALVHPRVSFKVFDIESQEELLGTCSSPSPLSLLSTNFGTEAASSLSELVASKGELKLSGYLSTPFGISSPKAFQYIYINSRFVSKGRIHKLVNELAAVYLDDTTHCGHSQIEKPGRSLTCPTFILNLSCPRSHYDIVFEPLKSSVEFTDWGPVLEFIQDAVTHFWSENASDDLPEYCESRRKKSRTHKWSSPVEVPFSQSKKQIVDEIGLSSCQMRNRGASELIKHHKDAFLTRGADCAIHLFDTSLFASGVTTSKMIHRGEPVSDNLYSNVDNYILNSTKDSSCKKLDYLSDSKWRSGPSLMKDQMDMLTKSSLCADFHEVTDADANRVFGKSYQLSSLKGISLQDVGPSFPYEAGIEFSNAELSMQRRHLHIGEDVDVGNQYDTDLIFEENEPRHNIVKPLWLSKCANQHDKMLKSKSLSHDVRPSIIAGEWSDEENFFGSYSFEDGKKYGINRLSSTSELSPRISNCLFGQIPDTVHFMGGDVHSKNGKDTEYDYYEDREEKYCNFNSDAAVNCLDVAHSTEVFSDCKYYSSLQGDFGEIRGDKLKYSCSTNFSDEENWLCTNKSGKSTRLNSSDPLSYKSVLTELDSNKFERIQTENRKAQVHRREARRSISAPPLYKRRRKFFDLNNMFEIAAEQIDSDDTTLAISNAKHDLQAFDERRCPPKQSYVSDSLCIPRLENEGFQKKDFMSNEIQGSSEYDVKWQKSCEQAMGVMKTQNAGDDDILNVSSGILHFACDSLVPASISKTCFRDAKVLRQVDKKFIPVVAGNILAMIDQHAADERIRLEELRQKVLSGEMRQITYLETEKELVLPEIDYQLLHNYGEQAQNWGWICNICGPSSRSFAKKMNVLHRQQTVAKLIAVPCILGVNLTDNDLLEFLKQLADTDGSSTVPPSVLRILNNKACRGAIMFGDTLLPSECSLIVEELKRTSLCFQCAHGRPTTVPLVNLEVLHRQIDKLALRRKGKQELWHGLGRHEISLERAAYRLNSAMN